MPTPPTYTNAFKVIGSLVDSGTGEPSWGYFRSCPIGVSAYAVDRAGSTYSYDYVDTAYAGISAMTNTLYRSWSPFQLQMVFNNPSGSLPSGVVVRGWVFGDPDDYDRPLVATEDFSLGMVGATVTAYDLSVPGYATFTLADEAGNHNGVAQDTVTFQGPITSIVLP